MQPAQEEQREINRLVTALDAKRDARVLVLTRQLPASSERCAGRPPYCGFLSLSRKCLRNFATFGATTNWQYGW